MDRPAHGGVLLIASTLWATLRGCPEGPHHRNLNQFAEDFGHNSVAKHAELGAVRKRYEQRPVLASVTGAFKLHFNEICCFRSSGSRKTHRDWPSW